MGYKEMYEEWLNNPYFDDATKAELKAIEGNEKEIEDRFYMDLEFGTAGLRGVIGAGTNRMNVYTVRKATQGLANYINNVHAQEKGVAIAYDSRHMSPEFADVAALCLAANGIKAYVFESLRPTPELSYAVRKLGCTAGINITASHNPPEYNGYKVYWEDGAQITPPHDTGIMAEVKKVTDYAAVKTMDKAAAVAAGLYQVIGADIDDPYIEELKKLILHQDCIDKVAGELKIVYSPLHGTGNIPVRRVLKELGFKNVYVVPEQELPDGDFPTVSYPNPEAAEAFELGLALGKKVDADLILATDPDADRLGVYVKDSKTGEYHSLTGNMSGCLIGDYVIGQRKALYGLPEDGAFIRSIVSTNMADAIAKYYGIQLVEVLTGFKFIGQKILEFEKTGKGTYLFGMEESYGCLTGTYARDKDAVDASMTLCEAAAYYKTKNMTLWDAMLAMYERYGYYKDDVTAITLKGIEGLTKIQEIMNTLRENAPAEIGGYKVTAVRDYKKDTITDTATGAVKPTGLPASNVLYYELEDDAWVCVRPSGTEPKVKFYLGVKGTSLEDADAKSKALSEAVHAMIGKML
ncbi:MAG: phospho-sugar mutase [Roseburia sp.]|nr:phospho-sugar mutase [Roseburia sp.]